MIPWRGDRCKHMYVWATSANVALVTPGQKPFITEDTIPKLRLSTVFII